MIRCLLDVNLLVAMHVPESTRFQRAQKWFTRVGSKGFATCAITQSGFARVSKQLKLIDKAISGPESKAALQQVTSLPGHVYWPMDIQYLDAVHPFELRMQGYRSITDAFLLGLAVHHKAKLATLDRAIVHLAEPEFAKHVELIS